MSDSKYDSVKTPFVLFIAVIGVGFVLGYRNINDVVHSLIAASVIGYGYYSYKTYDPEKNRNYYTKSDGTKEYDDDKK